MPFHTDRAGIQGGGEESALDVEAGTTLETDFNSKSLLTSLANQADRFAPWIVVAILAEILVVGAVKAYYKPLWLDEIMGVLIAKLPASSDIWAICKSGADNQPPSYHYLMRASIRILGNDALGIRFPSVVGYAFFCLCLYWFVRRLTSGLYGLIAMLFPGLTHCWYYATEGRPYALSLACAGVCAVCWQSVVMQRRRTLMLAGMGLALAFALNLHYYNVLLFLPFGIAEAVRTYHRRKLDLPVWLALTAPFAVLFIYLPVVRASRVNSGIPNAPFASPIFFTALWRFAVEFFANSLIALMCFGVLYLAMRTFRRSSAAEFMKAAANRAQRIPEASLVLGFLCFPVFAISLSRFGTHIFFERYAIASMFGYAALLGLGSWFAFWGQKRPALALAYVFALLILRNQINEDLPMMRANRATPAQVSIPRRVPEFAQGDELPIVATNLDDFMQFSYYGSPKFRKRVFYVSSEALAKQYLGFTFHERMMIGSAPYFGTQVVDYATFLKEHPSFYVFGSLQFSEWVVPKLMADGAELQLVQGGPVNIYGGFADVCLRAQVHFDSPQRYY